MKARPEHATSSFGWSVVWHCETLLQKRGFAADPVRDRMKRILISSDGSGDMSREGNCSPTHPLTLARSGHQASKRAKLAHASCEAWCLAMH